MTLRFLGDVAPEPVVAALDRLPRRGPITLRLSGAGRFGGSVLWLGCAGDLDALVADVDAVLGGGRDRPFRAHLTVARTGRSPHPTDPALRELTTVRGPSFTVTELQLLRSAGGAYERLHVVPL